MTGLLRARIAAGTWAVSDSRTRVAFTVGNVGRPVHGSVACRWGRVQIGADGAPLRVRAEVDLDSLDTGIARRDADLRAPRFLDVDRHPTMTWSADRFTAGEDGAWRAEGVLAVRGTSAPLTLVGGPEAAAPDGSWLRVRATGVLDRTAVGIRAPSFLVGRPVRIAIDAWLTPALP
ncbi:YceI family protein [Geodermatophilus sp. SYSU D00815]